jgi:hypothetical protein
MMSSPERELLETVLYTHSGDALDFLRDNIRALLAQPEQTEQEPVAWMNESGGCFLSDGNKYSENWTALYTSPPKREPLSDDRLRDISNSIHAHPDFENVSVWQAFYIARAIEKAHGIEK